MARRLQRLPGMVRLRLHRRLVSECRSHRETGADTQNNNAPVNSSHGIKCRKSACPVWQQNQRATHTPPSSDAASSICRQQVPPHIRLQLRERRQLSRARAPRCSWHLPTIGGTPMPSIAGNERNEPPPAMAFITPAMQRSRDQPRVSPVWSKKCGASGSILGLFRRVQVDRVLPARVGSPIRPLWRPHTWEAPVSPPVAAVCRRLTRTLADIEHRALLDQAALLHNRDSIAKIPHQRHGVRDETDTLGRSVLLQRLGAG